MMAAARKPPRPRLPLFNGKPVAAHKLPKPKEHVLHFSVAKFLNDFAHPDWRWTHFPAGEMRTDKTGAKLKRMGTKPGWPDFQLVSPAGLFHALELKRAGEGLTDTQDDFATWCHAHGIPHAVVHTFKDTVETLNRWGCLRIKFTGVL